MSVITDTVRFLLQRKLWPVAILMIAAAVAVPTLLGEEPPPPATAPAAGVKGDKAAVLATEPIVAPAADADRSGRRQVLGSSKNPFKPQVTPTPTPKPKVLKPATGAQTGATPGTGGSSVGASPAPSNSPTLPSGTTPPAKKKTYELNELSVRFGSSEATQPPRKDVKRLQALPSSATPVLIYLGVLKDKKTAVFLLDSGVVAQGDGTCMPTRTSCETIHIKEGETEFFDVATEDDSGTEGGGTQYQLDVLTIREKSTTSAKQASKSIARVSKSGRKILRARVMGDGPLRYRYDTRTGRLEKLSHKAFKAVVAKAAKAARAHF
jgi:hypothetical protein